MNNSKIFIILPTLNRPDRFSKILNDIARTSSDRVSISVIVDKSDKDSEQIARFKLFDRDRVKSKLDYLHVCDDNPDSVTKWNIGVRNILAFRELPDDSWLFQGSDDMEFSDPNWEEKILSTPNKGFIAIPDQHGIVDKSIRWYQPFFMGTVKWFKENQGRVFCVPHYKHWGVDVEVCERAHCSSTYACASLVFNHNHFLWNKSMEDSTYRKGRVHWDRDLELLKSRREKGFPNDFEGYL